jgi:homoaconitase/3-isopropylmalate dehydratase large subunit
VYKDEPGTLKEEDPFKKVPMMDDHEKPSSMMEMEKSVDAMVALVEHTPGSPVPEEATSLEKQLSNENLDSPVHLVSGGSSNSSAQGAVDVLGGAGHGIESAPPVAPSQPSDHATAKGLGVALTSPT